MGLCGSSMTPEQKEEAARNKALNKNINDDHDADQALVKLLLLGAGEAGKRTIFKQMRILYGDGFDDAARQVMASTILQNLMNGTQTVLANCDRLGFTLTGEAAEAGKRCALEWKPASTINAILEPSLAADIATLWKDENYQNTYEQRQEYQLFDCYCDFAKKMTTDYPKWGGEVDG